jgi:quercetin dioxygenase-like cupin family protein
VIVRYVRPFDLKPSQPGTERAPLIDAEEGFGVSIRLARGGTADESPRGSGERFSLILAGEGTLHTHNASIQAPKGSVVFSPPGATGVLRGPEDTYWLNVEATSAHSSVTAGDARVIKIDASRFEGAGFAHQSLIDRSMGCESLRLNVLQVQPGSGSPDFHIHAFAQIYVIVEGQMTLDIGQARHTACGHSIVCLPPGVVHRNFNASGAVEKHYSLLIPEPQAGQVFDYAVDIHPHEAQLLTAIPR